MVLLCAEILCCNDAYEGRRYMWHRTVPHTTDAIRICSPQFRCYLRHLYCEAFGDVKQLKKKKKPESSVSASNPVIPLGTFPSSLATFVGKISQEDKKIH